jgi:hypothetical protein
LCWNAQEIKQETRPCQNAFFAPLRRDKSIFHPSVIILLIQTPEAYNTMFSGRGVLTIFLNRIKTDMLTSLNQTSFEKYFFHDSLKQETAPLPSLIIFLLQNEIKGVQTSTGSPQKFTSIMCTRHRT